MQNAARVLNKEEQLKVVEEAKQRKAELMNACEERKNFMQTMELNRKENEKLSDLEQVEIIGNNLGIKHMLKLFQHVRTAVP